ncbi:hypothetical protein [Oenococcus sp.]|uniref:hypothetical protein n=1 Tax=Oenococcus sp. TaxID=1979414 RepID=UPI0039EB1066
MIYSEFPQAFVAATGLGLRYLKWKSVSTDPNPVLPYCLYLLNPSDDVQADDGHYLQIANVQFEFYSNKQDSASRSKIEAFFDANDISWSFEGDTYLDTELMEMAVYQIQLFK